MIGALVVGLNLPLLGATISGDTIVSQRRTAEGTDKAIMQEIEQSDVFLKVDISSIPAKDSGLYQGIVSKSYKGDYGNGSIVEMNITPGVWEPTSIKAAYVLAKKNTKPLEISVIIPIAQRAKSIAQKCIEFEIRRLFGAQ